MGLQSLCLDSQVVEVRHGICFCPKTDFTCVLESIVTRLDFFHAVVVASKLVSCRFHTQLVPDSRRDLEVATRKLYAAAVDDMIEPVVVLQAVPATDVILVPIL